MAGGRRLRPGPLSTFLHRCFELTAPGADQIQRLGTRAGATIDRQTAERIAGSATRFNQWLEGYFTIQRIEREVPLLGLDANGSVVSGAADLVVETPEGIWIIDHKSDRVDDPAATFQHYLPQLESYGVLLADAGYTVLRIGVNWIRSAETAMVVYR